MTSPTQAAEPSASQAGRRPDAFAEEATSYWKPVEELVRHEMRVGEAGQASPRSVTWAPAVGRPLLRGPAVGIERDGVRGDAGPLGHVARSRKPTGMPSGRFSFSAVLGWTCIELGPQVGDPRVAGLGRAGWRCRGRAHGDERSHIVVTRRADGSGRPRARLAAPCCSGVSSSQCPMSQRVGPLAELIGGGSPAGTSTPGSGPTASTKARRAASSGSGNSVAGDAGGHLPPRILRAPAPRGRR